jgi:hypothetical protein
MSGPRFKVAHIRWWHRPIKLVKRTSGVTFDHIGWVWNQRAYLVDNLHEGWIAFVEDQTPENIECWFCDQCGASVWGKRRSMIEAALEQTK